MYVKKIKRKCGVRGCKNTETYSISKSREMGNSIIACKECMLETLAEIEVKYAPVEAPAEAVTVAFAEAPAVDEVVDKVVDEAPTESPITPKKRKK